MRRSVRLRLKGVRYYAGFELAQSGSLPQGLAVTLYHQRDNPHDVNAVQVRVATSRAVLGHIPRALAPKYAALVNANRIIESAIDAVECLDGWVTIDVRIAYEDPDDDTSAVRDTRLWQSASSMPDSTGVYQITEITSGTQYIGSSDGLKSRLMQHIGQLARGTHTNGPLQADFTRLGGDSFEARVLASGLSKRAALSEERLRIERLVAAGRPLYNLTDDGKGRFTRTQPQRQSRESSAGQVNRRVGTPESSAPPPSPLKVGPVTRQVPPRGSVWDWVKIILMVALCVALFWLRKR